MKYFKTVKQVEENAGAMGSGPLSKDQMQQIDEMLGERTPNILLKAIID
jgi:aryl-alcohol dehydrogenase-like predicted oxidoreductase